MVLTPAVIDLCLDKVTDLVQVDGALIRLEPLTQVDWELVGGLRTLMHRHVSLCVKSATRFLEEDHELELVHLLQGAIFGKSLNACDVDRPSTLITTIVAASSIALNVFKAATFALAITFTLAVFVSSQQRRIVLVVATIFLCSRWEESMGIEVNRITLGVCLASRQSEKSSSSCIQKEWSLGLICPSMVAQSSSWSNGVGPIGLSYNELGKHRCFYLFIVFVASFKKVSLVMIAVLILLSIFIINFTHRT